MEGLSIPSSCATYDVVVVREYLDDYVGTSPNAMFESEFRRLVVCLRIKDVAVVVDFQWRGLCFHEYCLYLK